MAGKLCIRLTNERSGVAIPTSGRISRRSFSLCPLESVRVEDPEVTVVLFPIVAAEHVQLLFVESGSMIFNLWSGVTLCSAAPSAAASSIVTITSALHLLA